MAPICKSLGHLTVTRRGKGVDTQQMEGQNGWMKPRESPKSKINTYYLPDSVSLAIDHVNGVRRSRVDKVMD